MSKKSYTNLFLELAKPDKNGISDWVSTKRFTGDYDSLKLGNGLSWGRRGSPLAKKYKIETKKIGRRIIAIRLNGFNNEESFNQRISPDIAAEIKKQKCVMLGINGTSENTIIEVDHKDGRKNDSRVSDTKTQLISDFQPLCKAANDIKRQLCKECKRTNRRWDAKNILGNPYSFYDGDEFYDEQIGCKGCYQYDPVAYRIECAKKICKEATSFTLDCVMSKLYPEWKKK